MAASIHSLHPGTQETRTQVHPLLAELRDTSLGQLDELARRMFDNADDALFEMGEKAGSDGERRHYFDTMRVLRMDRSRIAREFIAQLEAGFAPKPARPQAVAGAEVDAEELKIQSREELEEKIALSNLAAKIEGLYKGSLWDVERRLELAFARGIPVSPEVLNPNRLCEAFGQATAILDASFEVKLVIYKLFDRVLSKELGPVYQSAIQVLDRGGIDMRRPKSATSLADERIAAVESVLDMLRQHDVDPDQLRIGNDPAAASLKDLLQTLARRDGPEHFGATAQRLSMAGQLFNDLLAEPLLGDTLKQAFEPLRYPLYRTALTDGAFFTSPTHPTRKMLGDLIELAAGTQTGEVSIARFRSLLQSMVTQLDAAATAETEQVSRQRTPPAPLTGLELNGFLSELREQARTRRNALLLHVRRIIAQEIELRTIGREVPKAVQSLLRSGVGPLMAMRLLRNGRGSPNFRDAELLVDRVVDSLEAVSAEPDKLRNEREALIATIATAFKEVGMDEARSNSLLTGLKLVYAMLDQATVELGKMGPLSDIERARAMSDYGTEVAAHQADVATAQASAKSALDGGLPRVTVIELLGRILAPESWYRVHDAAQSQTRWLKLASFYPQQDSVTFTGFDESTRLSLRASRLADDLALGLSEPINPSATAREALEQLRQGRERGLF